MGEVPVPGEVVRHGEVVWGRLVVVVVLVVQLVRVGFAEYAVQMGTSCPFIFEVGVQFLWTHLAPVYESVRHRSCSA